MELHRTDKSKTTRRTLLLAGAGLATTAGAAGLLSKTSKSTLLRPTPKQVEGPYFPGETLIKKADSDLLNNGPVPARGIEVLLGGKVLDLAGRPVAGAQVSIWQCDAEGVYHHERDDGTPDPHFQGFGHTLSSQDGTYLFRTIKPVPYGSRTPHIHFKVEAHRFETLVTQLYVAEEAALNSKDSVYKELDAEEAAAVTASFSLGKSGRLQASFDIKIAPV